MVAYLTGQPLLEHVPQRNFWKLGLSHAYRATCEQISGCTTDVPIQMRLWLRLPGARCARCIDERPLNEFRSNMPSNSDWQGQAKSTSVPHSGSPVSYRILTCRTDVLLAVRSPMCCLTVMKYFCLSYCVLSWECHDASTLCPSPSRHGTYWPNVPWRSTKTSAIGTFDSTIVA